MTTEHSASGDLDRSLALLWELDQPPRRGPKPGLTLERIVAVAIAIADDEGLAALSMRRVAAELGVGTMSLYRYVPGKGELLDLMLDRVNEPVDDDEDPAERGWRTVLERFGQGTWDLCVAHPWFLQIDQARPLLGPRTMAGLDHTLRGLRHVALTDQEKMLAISTVYGFVVGVARDHVNAVHATARTGKTDEEFWAAQVPVFEKAVSGGAYPYMAALSEATFDFSLERVRDFGLRNLLDGLESYVEGKSTDAAGENRE